MRGQSPDGDDPMKMKKETDIEEENGIPILPIGKYKGKRIDQVPNAYLRWMLTKPFPEELLKYAREKVNKNKSSDIDLDCTRHSIDSYSLRFIDRWINRMDKNIGLASFVALKAEEAYGKGQDVSKQRHQDEELIKLYDGIRYVFNRDGELRILITVMP